MTDPNEDEFFDSATSEFPAKEDLNGRLVAIWNLGKEGTRVSEATGKPYPWVETVTLVLDDGPDNWYATNIKRPMLDGKGDFIPGPDDSLVPSVQLSGPQRLDGFQWSATGIYSRASKRAVGGKPMIGRINSRKNKNKGMADAWSIAECTSADVEVARSHRSAIMALTAELAAAAQHASDSEAFDA